MVLGKKNEKAHAITSVDAAFQVKDKELQHTIQHILTAKAAVIAEKEEIERNLVASTSGNFENMVKG